PRRPSDPPGRGGACGGSRRAATGHAERPREHGRTGRLPVTPSDPRSKPPTGAEGSRPPDPRSSIPSVDRILLEPGLEPLAERYGRERVLAGPREAVSDVRARLGQSAGLPRPAGRGGKASGGAAGARSHPSPSA